MIIDCHVHCFPDALAAKAVPSLAEAAGVPARLDGTLAAIQDSMREAQIDLSVVVSIATRPGQTTKINDWSAAIHSESIVAFGSIHPDFGDWKSEIRRIRKLGLKGLKFHPDYQEFFVDEPRVLPIYESAFEEDLIILFHAGVDIGLPPPYHCTPERLLKVIETFPEGKIIAAHMGSYACWDDVERYLVGTPLYFDTSYSLGHMSDEQALRMIANHGAGKFVFATDSPWTSQAEELLRFNQLGLEQSVRAAILGENARRLLGC